MNSNNFSYIGNHTQHIYLAEYLADRDSIIEDRKEAEMINMSMDSSYYEHMDSLQHDLDDFSRCDPAIKVKNTLLNEILKPSYFEDNKNNPRFETVWQNIKAFFNYSDINNRFDFIQNYVIQTFKDLTVIDHAEFMINVQYTDTDFTKMVDDSMYLVFKLESSHAQRKIHSNEHIHAVHTPILSDLVDVLEKQNMPHYCNTLFKKCIYYVYQYDPILLCTEYLGDNFIEKLVTDYEQYKPIFDQSVALLEIIDI